MLGSVRQPRVPPRLHCGRARPPAAAPFLSPTSLEGCTAEAVPLELELRTGDERADSLSEPTSSFYIALHTSDGRVFLHTEPGRGAGALRGQCGGVDNVWFTVPSPFSDPVALWVAPAVGTWKVESANLRGRDSDGGAVLSFALAPVGGGELRRVRVVEPTLVQKAETRASGMAAYVTLKQRIIALSAALAVPGCGVAAFLTHGTHVILPFLVGASTGVAYVALLERGVDGLRGAGDGSAPARGTGAPARLAATLALLFIGARLSVSSDDSLHLRTELLALIVGFLLHRLAVLIVGFSSTAE